MSQDLSIISHDHATALGVPGDFIHAAAAVGKPLALILQYVLAYGLPVLSYLAKIWGIPLPPFPIPAPPLPTPPVN